MISKRKTAVSNKSNRKFSILKIVLLRSIDSTILIYYFLFFSYLYSSRLKNSTIYYRFEEYE